MAMVSSPAGLTIKVFFFFFFALQSWKLRVCLQQYTKNWKVVHLHFSKVLHTDYNVVKTSPFVMVSAPTYSVCYTEFPCAHDSFSIPIPGSFADPARVSPPDAFPSALYCPIQ